MDEITIYWSKVYHSNGFIINLFENNDVKIRKF